MELGLPLLCWLILTFHLLFSTPVGALTTVDQAGILRYSREQLWELRLQESSSDITTGLDLPREFQRGAETSRPKRRRGRSAGVRKRVRARGSRPPLPTVLLANVRSLSKQLTELQAAARYLTEYRDSCLLCFSETWLKPTIDNASLRVTGFSEPIRADRDPLLAEKESAGGLCVYVNERWCKNYMLRESYCAKVIELLSISCRRFYVLGAI